MSGEPYRESNRDNSIEDPSIIEARQRRDAALEEMKQKRDRRTDEIVRRYATTEADLASAYEALSPGKGWAEEAAKWRSRAESATARSEW